MARSGPLEVLVVRFTGAVLPDAVGEALRSIREDGGVNVVEAFLVRRTSLGAVRAEAAVTVIGEPGAARGRPASGPTSFWLDADSLAEVAVRMEPGSTALALVLEHRSAWDVVTVFQKIGGVVLVSTRPPRDTSHPE